MASAGPNFPGTVASVADGDVAWTNIGNVATDNGVTADIALTTGQASHTIRATNFSNDIAGGISNISITIDVVDVNGAMKFKHIFLVLGGVRITGDISGQALIGPGENTFSFPVQLSAAQVEAVSFGVDVAVTLNGASGDTQLDYISMTLTYTANPLQMDHRLLIPKLI